LQFYTFNCSYKVLTSGEVGTTITGMTGNTYIRKIMYIFRSPILPITVTVANVSNQGTSGTPTNQVIAAKSVYPYIVIGGSGGSTTSAGFSAWHQQNVTNGSANFAYKIFNESGASVTVGCSDSGTYTYLNSCSLNIT
jgi:hypothetical protein